eukprot:jgi/Bigna1/129469/aug1.9_g4177
MYRISFGRRGWRKFERYYFSSTRRFPLESAKASEIPLSSPQLNTPRSRRHGDDLRVISRRLSTNLDANSPTRGPSNSVSTKQLNEEQTRAVRAPLGTVRVHAGPGSGKTTVLAARVAYLIEELKVNPRDITCITFTNKVEPHLIENERRRGGSGGMEVIGRTDFTINDAEDQRKLIKAMTSGQSTTEVIGEISAEKHRDMADLIEQKTGICVLPSDSHRNSSGGQGILRVENCVDFDDLILLPIKALLEDRGTLEDTRYRHKHILVDEFQDINRFQLELIRLLSPVSSSSPALSSHNGAGIGKEDDVSLFVVGDEDQSIYGWRGADLRCQEAFHEAYPDCRVFSLYLNYRSLKSIVHAARLVLGKNLEDDEGCEEEKQCEELREKEDEEDTGWGRITLLEGEEGDEKEYAALDASKEGKKSSSSMNRDQSYSPMNQSTFKVSMREMRKEAEAIADWVASRYYRSANKEGKGKEDDHDKDIAVLYRTRNQGKHIEKSLRMRGIYCQNLQAIGLSDRAEVKDVLSYLRLVANVEDRAALERIYNVPRRSLGLKGWGAIQATAESLNMSCASLVMDIYRTHAASSLNETCEAGQDQTKKQSQGSAAEEVAAERNDDSSGAQSLSEVVKARIPKRTIAAAAELGRVLLELKNLGKTSPPMPTYEVIERILTLTRYREGFILAGDDGNQVGDEEDDPREFDPITMLVMMAQAEEKFVSLIDNVDDTGSEINTGASVLRFVQTLVLGAPDDNSSTSPSNEDAGRRNPVIIGTLHSSKGKEFDTVVIAGCCEGLIPHFFSQESIESIEEERRLLYVGMTRAKDELCLSTIGRMRSGFLDAIFDAQPFYLKHKKYFLHE